CRLRPGSAAPGSARWRTMMTVQRPAVLLGREQPQWREVQPQSRRVPRVLCWQRQGRRARRRWLRPAAAPLHNELPRAPSRGWSPLLLLRRAAGRSDAVRAHWAWRGPPAGGTDQYAPELLDA